MNPYKVLVVLVGAFTLLQSCDVAVHDGDDWHWNHGGWHHDHGHHGHDGDDDHDHDFALELARDFGIRPDSAATITQLAQSDLNAEKAAKLGLNGSDLAALIELQMPSQDGINHVANALNEDPAKIQRIAKSFVTSVQAQKSDVTSEYWQDCMKSGRWTTSENIYCASIGWNGCSPATGASSCTPAE